MLENALFSYEIQYEKCGKLFQKKNGKIEILIILVLDGYKIGKV